MRPRSRLFALVLGLLVAGAVLLIGQRWRSARALSVPPVAEVARAARPGHPVFLVGLDGADWQLLDRYVAAGVMPNLAALVQEGAGGILLSQHPPLSPLVWTSMMTGASPIEHGILDFTRFNPLDGREEPITSDERRLPAVWSMATAAGRRVAVIGLWATYPAEAVNGLVVSDRFFPSLLRTESTAPGLPALARRGHVEQFRQSPEPLRPSRNRAAPHPGRDPPRSCPGHGSDPGRGSRPRGRLLRGDGQHRSSLRALRSPAPAERRPRGVRALPAGPGALLPLGRRPARRVPPDGRGARGRPVSRVGPRVLLG